MSSEQPNDDKQTNKRSFLEVSEIDKYKNFLIKQQPLETKRFKPSDTLDKVRQFLPMLKESTEKLLNEYKEDPSKVDIENCENDENVIEMNLQFVCNSSNSGESDDDDEEEEEEDDDEENENDEDVQPGCSTNNKPKEMLDLEKLIEKGYKNNEIKISSDSVFKKKKPLIKIISNNDDDDKEDNESSNTNITDNDNHDHETNDSIKDINENKS